MSSNVLFVLNSSKTEPWRFSIFTILQMIDLGTDLVNKETCQGARMKDNLLLTGGEGVQWNFPSYHL